MPVTLWGMLIPIYTMILLLIGLPSNVLCAFIVASNKSMRSTTKLLMILLAICDSSVLLIAVPRYWAISLFAVDIRSQNIVLCKLHVFTVAVLTDLAVYLLCLLSTERCLLVAFPHRAARHVTPGSVSLSILLLSLLVTGKNMVHFWMMTLAGPVTRVNRSIGHQVAPTVDSRLHCKPGEDYEEASQTFQLIDFISFAVLPYIVIFSSNIYIYVKLRNHRRQLRTQPSASLEILMRRSRVAVLKALPNADNGDRASLPSANRTQPFSSLSCGTPGDKPRQQPPPGRPDVVGSRRCPASIVNVLIMLATVHGVCTLPGTVYIFVTRYLSDEYRRTKQYEFVKACLVMLVYTNNAVNILAYCIFAPFRRQLKQCLARWFGCCRG